MRSSCRYLPYTNIDQSYANHCVIWSGLLALPAFPSMPPRSCHLTDVAAAVVIEIVSVKEVPVPQFAPFKCDRGCRHVTPSLTDEEGGPADAPRGCSQLRRAAMLPVVPLDSDES